MSIAYQSDQGIARLTFDRPAKKNAITAEMYEQFVAGLKQAAADTSVRAVLVSGAGGTFTAGNDLKDFSNPKFAQPDSPVLSFMLGIAAFEKPVVAAVHGMAVGIGVTMLLHCDLVYAADDATFSMPFTSLGLVPELASTLLFPQIAGRGARSRETAAWQARSRRTRRWSWGSRTRVLPSAESLPHAEKIARAFTKLPPGAVRDTKRLLREGLGSSVKEAILREAGCLALGLPARRHAKPSRPSWRSGRRTSRSSSRAMALLDRTTPSLPAAWYFDPAQHSRELEAIWYRDWVCVGRIEDLPEAGDYFLIELGAERIIVTRDREGRPRAFHNTCRHRGSTLCTAPRGRFAAGRITCPYHAWSYALSGELVATPKMDLPADFRREDFPLYAVQADTWGGFLFVNIAERPSTTLAEFLGEEAGHVARWPLGSLVSVHREVTTLACNWKLFWENYSECYHCPGIHPELCRVMPLYREGVLSYADRRATPASGESAGHTTARGGRPRPPGRSTARRNCRSSKARVPQTARPASCSPHSRRASSSSRTRTTCAASASCRADPKAST